MAARGGLALATLALLVAVCGGCETEVLYPDCARGDALDVGERREACPKSVFTVPRDARSRDVGGIVWQSDSGLASARLHITPLAGNPTASATLLSGPSGFFGPVADVGFHYDLTAFIGRDVLAFRGLTTRFVQPALEPEPRSLGAGWSKQVEIKLSRPAAAGHSLAFFANGGNVYGITGDLARGFTITDRDFNGPATVHVVEYETGKDLATASAYGKAELLALTPLPQIVVINLEPIRQFEEVRFDVAVPPGLTSDGIDLVMGYSRSSYAPLTRVSLAETRRLPLIPNASFYATRARASAIDGSNTESGEKGFDVFAKRTIVELVSPPKVLGPEPGPVTLGTVFAADGVGVLEHFFVEEAAPHRQIRVLTTNRDMRLPEASVLQEATPRGAYRWSVRSYPKARFVDEIMGIDGRRYQAAATSAPRVVTF